MGSKVRNRSLLVLLTLLALALTGWLSVGKAWAEETAIELDGSAAEEGIVLGEAEGTADDQAEVEQEPIAEEGADLTVEQADPEEGAASNLSLRAMGSLYDDYSQNITLGREYKRTTNTYEEAFYHFTVSKDSNVRTAFYTKSADVYLDLYETKDFHCYEFSYYKASGYINKTVKLPKGDYVFAVRVFNKKGATYSFTIGGPAAAAKPTWSGASRIPVSATADIKVTNGGFIRLKSGGKWVTSDSVLSLSAPSTTTKRIQGKRAGSTTLYLLDQNGKQVASKTVTVYDITSGKWEMQSSVDKNYVLDIRGRSKANGARMIVWKRNNQSNQRYQFLRQSDGTYLIRCCHSGRFVDVQGGGTRSAQAVIQWTRNARDNQRWRVSVDAYNRVTFTCKRSGMCFDIQGGKITSAAQMIQWPSNGRNNQKWVLNRK